MTLKPGKQTITVHILPNISQSKGNKTMKSGQVLEYSKVNIFFKNHIEKEAGRLVPDLFLIWKKASYEVTVSGLQLSFNFDSPTWHA